MFNLFKNSDDKKISQLCVGLDETIWMPEKLDKILVDTLSCYKFNETYYSRWKIYDKNITYIWFITIQNDVILQVVVSKRKESHLHYKNIILTLGEEISGAVEITKNYTYFNSFTTPPPYVLSLNEYGYI
jgi:hypothetical protein